LDHLLKSDEPIRRLDYPVLAAKGQRRDWRWTHAESFASADEACLKAVENLGECAANANANSGLFSRRQRTFHDENMPIVRELSRQVAARRKDTSTAADERRERQGWAETAPSMNGAGMGN